jgi:hypothetical protein
VECSTIQSGRYCGLHRSPHSRRQSLRQRHTTLFRPTMFRRPRLSRPPTMVSRLHTGLHTTPPPTFLRSLLHVESIASDDVSASASSSLFWTLILPDQSQTSRTLCSSYSFAAEPEDDCLPIHVTWVPLFPCIASVSLLSSAIIALLPPL